VRVTCFWASFMALATDPVTFFRLPTHTHTPHRPAHHNSGTGSVSIVQRRSSGMEGPRGLGCRCRCSGAQGVHGIGGMVEDSPPNYVDRAIRTLAPTRCSNRVHTSIASTVKLLQGVRGGVGRGGGVRVQLPQQLA
jgi:hypothetical protein